MEWKCRDRVLRIDEGAPLLMGILNVTPDSFSDGGRYLHTEEAVERGLQMLQDGADILDIGGESTRPGATEVSAEEEKARVIPVIRGIAARSRATLSVDTSKAEVARCAIEAGAHIVNDVSAMTRDPAMPGVARESGAGVVLMHMQGTPRSMQENPRYADVTAEVREYLRARVATLVAEGFDPQTLAVDPGIGFGKTVEHNVSLLANLAALRKTGRPVVIGLSRKRFLGHLTGREVNERLSASLAGLVFCVLNGAHILRVHDVRESRDAIRVTGSLQRAREGQHARVD